MLWRSPLTFWWSGAMCNFSSHPIGFPRSFWHCDDPTLKILPLFDFWGIILLPIWLLLLFRPSCPQTHLPWVPFLVSLLPLSSADHSWASHLLLELLPHCELCYCTPACLLSQCYFPSASWMSHSKWYLGMANVTSLLLNSLSHDPSLIPLGSFLTSVAPNPIRLDVKSCLFHLLHLDHSVACTDTTALNLSPGRNLFSLQLIFFSSNLHQNH